MICMKDRILSISINEGELCDIDFSQKTIVFTVSHRMVLDIKSGRKLDPIKENIEPKIPNVSHFQGYLNKKIIIFMSKC